MPARIFPTTKRMPTAETAPRLSFDLEVRLRATGDGSWRILHALAFAIRQYIRLPITVMGHRYSKGTTGHRTGMRTAKTRYALKPVHLRFPTTACILVRRAAESNHWNLCSCIASWSRALTYVTRPKMSNT